MTPAALLLHGFTHTGSSWDPVIAALGERYRVIAPDIRGHGSAADLVPVTLDAVIADLETVAPADAFTLAGYSMGGRIALHAALAMPERVGRLVLIGASPGIADPTERERRRRDDEQLATEIEASSIDEFAQRWAESPLLAGMPDAVRSRVHRDRLRNTPPGLARALRGLGTGALPSLWGRLDELKMPVTLVAGERDQRFTSIARQMAKLIDEVDVVVVPGAGHAVHLEAPEGVAEIVAC
jgi:2-succinyl-6-hydroxy-2,4-cyclohexadiene-1-carboxylate synthase